MYPSLFPNHHYWWYPLGNTPAVDFLREARKNGDGSIKILSLACGDPRSILYTLWCERGFSTYEMASDIILEAKDIGDS